VEHLTDEYKPLGSTVTDLSYFYVRDPFSRGLQQNASLLAIRVRATLGLHARDSGFFTSIALQFNGAVSWGLRSASLQFFARVAERRTSAFRGCPPLDALRALLEHIVPSGPKSVLTGVFHPGTGRAPVTSLRPLFVLRQLRRC
jgi:hypothetical protein